MISDTDPTLQLWFEWQAADHRYRQLCNQRYGIEAWLFRQTDHSEVQICLPGADATVLVTEEELEIILESANLEDARAIASAYLAATTGRWARLDEQMGYGKAVQAETEAEARRSELGRALLDTPTRSVSGAAAKLSCFIALHSPAACDQFGQHLDVSRNARPTFPELRAILMDLIMIGGTANGLFRD